MKEGTDRITAASKTNPKKKATIAVSVTKDVPVMSIKLNKTKITVDEFNDKEIPLEVKKILPANAKNKKVKWSTSDEGVADVDDDGVVTTGDVGVAVIRAQAADKGGAFATCKVVVMENEDDGEDDGSDGPQETDLSTTAPGNQTSVPESPTDKPTTTLKPTLKPEESGVPFETSVPESPTDKPTTTLKPTLKPEESGVPFETSVPESPTDKPMPTLKPTADPLPAKTPPSIRDYEYFDDYTLGWYGGEIVIYKDGKRMSLSDAGVGVYDKDTDNIFAQHIPNNKWNDEKIILTPPIQYTTSDGVAHNVDSMLTNWNFCAEPTAIDNSDVDGKLYVYGTTEAIAYNDNDTMIKNAYSNHSLTLMSTKDMVNWTDEGFMDNRNLLNKTVAELDEFEKGIRDLKTSEQDPGVEIPGTETSAVGIPTPSPSEKPDVKEVDLMGELWTNGFYDRVVNEDGSITLTREQGDQDWQVGEFGFAVPRDLVGDPHEFTKVIIKYRNSDLTDSEKNCGYVFHFGDDTEVGWIEEEGGYHMNSLSFDGSGEAVIRIDGEEESNFSTVRIFDGKIGGKITIESVTLA